MSLTEANYNFAGTNHNLIIFIDVEKKVWFQANGIAKVLGHKDQRRIIYHHVSSYNKARFSKISQQSIIKVPRNWQLSTIFITEPGIYELVLKSRKREAVAFKAWVTSDLLPSMRDKFGLGVISQYLNTPGPIDVAQHTVPPSLGYVYVASVKSLHEYGMYKIGSSSDVDRRMSELNTGSPTDWFAICIFECSDRLTVEFQMHKILDLFRVKREIFLFKDDEEAARLCRMAFHKCNNK